MKRVRNVFDQYRHPENRLTHALAACLAADPRLLKSFLRWAGEADKFKGKALIVEQTLPGVAQGVDVEDLGRTLPDAWIFEEEGPGSLLIESKVAARVDAQQLLGHLQQARRRGYGNTTVLLLTAIPVNGLSDPRIRCRQWRDVYVWAKSEDSMWARTLAEYMDVAERRMLEDEYLTAGTLTTFSGIPFGEAYPQSYVEAKRLLKLLLEAVRKDPRLPKQLNADVDATGRPAITNQPSVWDFIPLLSASGDRFTASPHLTISLRKEWAIAQLTVPNSLASPLRSKLVGGGFKGFQQVIKAFADNADKVVALDAGASPYVEFLQRHYPSQRAVPITDAELHIDPRTLTGTSPAIKMQPQWIRAGYDAIAARKSNLQLAFGFRFPYDRSSTVATSQFAQTVAEAWLTTKPALASMGLV